MFPTVQQHAHLCLVTLDAADIGNSGTINYGEFLTVIEHFNKIVKEIIRLA